MKAAGGGGGDSSRVSGSRQEAGQGQAGAGAGGQGCPPDSEAQHSTERRRCGAQNNPPPSLPTKTFLISHCGVPSLQR